MTEPSVSRVPVSLVTGFLGSGKTTLIAALLKHPAMAGTAVIVNEFGMVGIDDAVFAQSLDSDNLRLLANGCLCCTASDDLTATVWSLARRDERPRRIVIETTGLAEPASVLRRLIGDPRLRASTRLDSVVATVDAVNGAATVEADSLAARQVAVADRRIITKGDMAGEEAVADLAARLHRVNPGADVRRVDHGQVHPDAVFGASLRREGDGEADVARWLNRDAFLLREHDHDRGPRAGTWLLEEDRPVCWDALARRLSPIIASRGDLLLRVKGVVHTVGDPRPLVIHGVQHVFHPPVRLGRWTAPPRTTIVAIGDRGAAPAIAEIADALALSVAAPAAP
jgi:G3E family GTPase